MYQEPGVSEATDQKKSNHYKTLVLSGLCWLFFILYIHFERKQALIDEEEDNGGFSYDDYTAETIIFMTFFIIFYIFYLIECCFSGTKSYLKNPQDIVIFDEYITNVKEAAPSLSFQIECYHFETRTRTVYYTDANGN
mmetsp:Transcript_15948/g.13507  ORF Transcript_15948/g.13507 Transcript_15948/m.13507 type:complete len:138 (-) Transcript_15948:559-972(-)